MMSLAPGGPAPCSVRAARPLAEAVSRINAAYAWTNRGSCSISSAAEKKLLLHGRSDARSSIAARRRKSLREIAVTIEMVGLALLLTLLIALPLGIYAGAHRGSLFDNTSSAIGLFLRNAVFWLSIVLIDVFAVQLRWFPSSGLSSLGREHDTLDRLGTSPCRCSPSRW